MAHAPLFFADGLRAANELAQAEPRALAALLARAGQGGGGGSGGSGSALPAGAGAALEYLVVGLRRLKVSDAAEVSAALVRLTPASAALAAALAGAAVAGGEAGGAASSSAGVPRLLGVDWAVTVPVASSAAAAAGGAGAGAGAPGVTLQLRVELPQGGTATRAVHLTVAQLALVEASVREAALSLERA